MTRCKFKCNSVTLFDGSKNVGMTPVINGSDENKDFWKYTPSGLLTLNVVNANVEFTPGQEYYLDISQA